MNQLVRTAAILAAIAASAASFSTARAQLVPRLVEYPVFVKANLTPADLAGRSTTGARCETGPAAISHERRVAFTEREWQETVRVFSGAICDAPALLFTLESAGTYVLGANSKTIRGGREGRLDVTSRRIVPAARGLAALRETCGQYAWTPDGAQDISANGCGSIPPVALCPSERAVIAQTAVGVDVIVDENGAACPSAVAGR